MQLFQLQAFKRRVKRLYPNQKEALDRAIAELLDNPALGQAKKADLAGVHVYKFHMAGQRTLLAYQYDRNELVLMALGDHENFYRDLKRS